MPRQVGGPSPSDVTSQQYHVGKQISRSVYIYFLVKTQDLLDATRIISRVQNELQPGPIGSLILSRVASYLESRFWVEPFATVDSANAFVCSEAWYTELNAATDSTETLPSIENLA